MPNIAAVQDWLLEESEPSIRYRTLIELLDVPGTDAEVMRARRAIAQSKATRSIFARMHEDGYWLQKNHAGELVGDGVEYGSFATTHFCLAALAELGLDRHDPRVAKAAERYLGLQGADGDFWQHMSCLYGFNIRTFVMLGYQDDPRLQRSVALMAASAREDGGYLCDMHEGKRKKRFVKSCARGSAKALMAYATLPGLWETSSCRMLIEYFLRRGGIHRTGDAQTPVTREAILTLFPFTWGCGLLDVLVGMSTMGLGQRPELGRAWEILDAKRDPERRYRLDWSPTQSLLKAGKRGAPNKWVTLYALLALKYRDRRPQQPQEPEPE